MKVFEGRDFTTQTVDSNAMLLNKAAVDLMQLKDPVGLEMKYGNRNYTVIGVTENMVMASPYAPVQPMMALYGDRGGAFFYASVERRH